MRLIPTSYRCAVLSSLLLLHSCDSEKEQQPIEAPVAEASHQDAATESVEIVEIDLPLEGGVAVDAVSPQLSVAQRLQLSPELLDYSILVSLESLEEMAMVYEKSIEHNQKSVLAAMLTTPFRVDASKLRSEDQAFIAENKTLVDEFVAKIMALETVLPVEIEAIEKDYKSSLENLRAKHHEASYEILNLEETNDRILKAMGMEKKVEEFLADYTAKEALSQPVMMSKALRFMAQELRNLRSAQQ